MTVHAMTFTACPKCGYQRRPVDEAPDWQCPACGIAYHKYRAYLERVKAGVAPRSAAAGAPPIMANASIWSLLGVNVVTILMALILDWRLVDLMAVYWVQSIIIGASYFGRIMNLEKFSTENFKINNRSVDPTPQTKRQTGFFFLVHYGGFHLGYLVFLLAETPDGFSPDLGFVACGVAFAINHYFSYRYNLELDRQGTPNIGTLMFTPYARVVPMHMTIVFGAVTMGGGGVLLFGLLKTIADVVMHHIEHWSLARKREKTPAG